LCGTLWCHRHQVAALPVRRTTLRGTVRCYRHQVAALPVRRTTLRGTVWCCRHQVAALPVRRTTLLGTVRCFQVPCGRVTRTPHHVVWDCVCSRHFPRLCRLLVSARDFAPASQTSQHVPIVKLGHWVWKYNIPSHNDIHYSRRRQLSK
jgi:hypothetical protein